MDSKLLAQKIEDVKERVEKACAQCGRKPEGVKLIAISKKHSIERMKKAFELGQFSFGESYFQEAIQKQSELSDLKIEWHFVGGLQSKKIKDVVGRFDWIHSLDRESQIAAFEKSQYKGQKVLVQVNIDEEESKGGVKPGDLPQFLKQTLECESFHVKGLMAMPLMGSRQETFEKVRDLAKSCREIYANSHHSLNELSMGTSDDFEAAIKAGSTMIRLGTVLLGERPQ